MIESVNAKENTSLPTPERDDTSAPATLTPEDSHDPLEVTVASDQVDRSVVVNKALKNGASWCIRALVLFATAIVIGWIIKKLWAGILPVILAVILCTVLGPPTYWMRKHKVPGALAALISMLALIAAIGAVIYFIVPQIASQSQVLYLQAYEAILQVRLWLQGPTINIDSEQLDNLINEAAAWLQDQAATIASGVLTGISTVTSLTITLFVVIVLTFFFLKDGHKFLGWLRGVLGRKQGWHSTELLTRSWHTLSGFIKAQALVSLVDAIFIGIGLHFIGVPMASALAVITFMAGFIPIVGAVTAGALAVIIALISLGFTKALITLALILLVQQLEGNVLSPILQSRAMDLHPVIVLVSVTVGGGLFGIVGAFLAVPVAAMVAVAMRYAQDMLRLRSGELTTSDITFSTRAGLAIGTVVQHDAAAEREARGLNAAPAPIEDPEAMPDGNEDEFSVSASLHNAGSAATSKARNLAEKFKR
ncbi:transporter of the permease [Corynebacterium renale]|uniref:AI-2E family transporter n=1 Tax=Corynebacterium renale TaxID=1724 RepID=UPI000DA400D3|nr:AI-2E family transporter [Corynebacterium renale]SQG64397.1 transporter of the permease [Corynebacterium renale]STC95151.1 transporter of the permease [Corynebacterium renale]